MFPIINPFEAAAAWHTGMSQIFEATVKMQMGAGIMVLKTMHDTMQGPPPEYTVDGTVIYSKALTPRRFAEVTAG